MPRAEMRTLPSTRHLAEYFPSTWTVTCPLGEENKNALPTAPLNLFVQAEKTVEEFVMLLFVTELRIVLCMIWTPIENLGANLGGKKIQKRSPRNLPPSSLVLYPFNAENVLFFNS
jgi:hypothetical protein